MLVAGPCSAYPSEALLKYARKVAEIQKEVEDKIKIVMRVYTQKPRSTVGWSGPLIQPDPFSKPNITKGLSECRKNFLEIVKIDLPVADELLFPDSYLYFGDLYSLLALGARSAEDHCHRLYASSLKIPVGVKNPSSGSLDILLNSCLSAASPHSFFAPSFDGFKQIDTKGNEDAFFILRGGERGPNYQKKFVKELYDKSRKMSLERSCVIDLNHGNSGKDALKQPKILKEILSYLKKDKKLKDFTKGFMLESFLKDGNQDISLLDKKSFDKNGLSITDKCLGIEKTEKVIFDLYKNI